MTVTIPITLSETSGIERTAAPVRIGVPFPMGCLTSGASLSLESPKGVSIPVQTRPAALWPDGSVKWSLLDFLATASASDTTVYRGYVSNSRPEENSDPSIQIVNLENGGMTVDTGIARFSISGDINYPLRTIDVKGEQIVPRTRICFKGKQGGEIAATSALLSVETSGPVCAIIRMEGSLNHGGKVVANLTLRLEFFAGSALCRMEAILHNPNAARHPGGLWDLGDPGSLPFSDFSLILEGIDHEKPVEWKSTPTDSPRAANTDDFCLYQDSSGGANWSSPNHRDAAGNLTVREAGFKITAGDASNSPLQTGERATPTLRVFSSGGWMSASVLDFWQNFPKALSVKDGALRVGLFPGECQAGFELQGGEKKRHTVLLNFGIEDDTDRIRDLVVPLLPGLDPQWVSQTGAVSGFLPEAQDANAPYLNYVQNTIDGPNSFFSKREIIDEYGWRNYGDLYADHEAVRHNGPETFISHYNNQYDFIYGALIQFLRSGDNRWFDLMTASARHTIDIDIYHTNEDKAAYNHGLFWHTDHYRDAGTCTHRGYTKLSLKNGTPKDYGGGPSNEQNYASGLLHYHYLTGDPEARGAVLELAGWVLDMDDGSRTFLSILDDGPTGVASQTVSTGFHHPGRGAGNSINTLMDAYRLDNDRKYISKVEELIQRCIHPRDDITALGLDEPEYRWSYLVFLQILGKYLDLKSELGETDYHFFYARDSLLHYADWMMENEVPYKDVLHKVDTPTETWPAQDIRKSCVLNLAGKYAPETTAANYFEKARFFFDRCLEDLLSFDTAHLTRPMVLLTVYGTQQGYFDKNKAQRPLYQKHNHDFGAPIEFLPQKMRAKRRFLQKLSVTWKESFRMLKERF